MAFIELVGLDELKLYSETTKAIEALALAPEYVEANDIDDLFFAENNSLGWSWSEKGVVNKDLLMDYCDKFQSKALFRRVKLFFKA